MPRSEPATAAPALGRPLGARTIEIVFHTDSWRTRSSSVALGSLLTDSRPAARSAIFCQLLLANLAM